MLIYTNYNPNKIGLLSNAYHSTLNSISPDVGPGCLKIYGVCSLHGIKKICEANVLSGQLKVGRNLICPVLLHCVSV